MNNELKVVPATELDDRPTEINICCIVKNDVSIKKMIESFKYISDRFFILDMMSTDETLKIIQDMIFDEKLPIVLFEQPFENFVHSKNFILNKTYTYLRNHQDKKQVIIFVESDEYLVKGYEENLPFEELKFLSIRKRIENIQPNQVFKIDINRLDDNYQYTSDRIWVYNPSKPLFFNGPFGFEYLDVTNHQIINTDITFNCQMNPNVDINNKLNLCIELLNKYISMSNNQDKNWMRAMFYLGQTYKYKGDSNKAIEKWETYLMNYNPQFHNNPSERFIVAYNIAQEYYEKGFMQLAMNCARKCIEEYKDTTCFRREPYLIIYSILFNQYWDNKDDLEKIIYKIELVINTESNPQPTTKDFDTKTIFYLEELKKQILERVSQLGEQDGINL